MGSVPRVRPEGVGSRSRWLPIYFKVSPSDIDHGRRRLQKLDRDAGFKTNIRAKGEQSESARKWKARMEAGHGMQVM